MLLRDLLFDLTSSSSTSSSDAGYATGDGENGGYGGLLDISDADGDSDGDLIFTDDADGTEGLDGGGGFDGWYASRS